jgi:hypothetical protein
LFPAHGECSIKLSRFERQADAFPDELVVVPHAFRQVDEGAHCVEKDRFKHVAFVFVVTAD